MSSLFFLPIPKFVQKLKLDSFLTIEELCFLAGIKCLASGEWINRKVEIKHGPIFVIEAEPGDWSPIRITIKKTSPNEEAKIALQVLAYVFHDLVAKESIKGHSWAKISQPRGRLRTGKALTNSERQRLFRKRHLDEV